MVQVGGVAVLITAALAALWRAGAVVVERERRRAEVVAALANADDALAGSGAIGLALVPEWPETLDPEEWDILDRWLAESAMKALAPFGRLGARGGFFIPSEERYLGSVASRPDGPPRPAEPPSGESDLIDAQVRAALERERPAALVVEGPAGTVALRAAPVWVNQRRVAATWTLAPLDDGVSLAAALRGYRLAAGLALGGIGLALVLSAGLARTVRRQAREKAAIQAELRRSERLAALGKLLAGVAHEVRNPLAGIRSTAQLWQRGIGPDDESIGGVVAEVDRLDALVGRLLHFSRADAVKRPPGDLNAVVAEAARLAAPAAEGQGVRVELDLQRGIPPARMAAPSVLQVLRNLTSNAVQAMPKGGVLRLSTRYDAATGSVEAAVRDTGPGLSDEARRHLFEPFFTTRPEGTGLGLAIAREIALAHGGDLSTAPPEIYTGAVFVLRLPVADDAPSG